MTARSGSGAQKPSRGAARQALLTAGLRLFAEQGYQGTTTRQVAAEAGVSHALLRYHFSSKAGLREEIDADVLTSFGRALASSTVKSDDPLANAGQAAAEVFGADQDRRRYIRRVLVDSDERAAELLGRLLSGAERELERLLPNPDVLAAEDRRWAAHQVLFLILGPLLLEPVLTAITGSDPFEPALLADRSAANQRLLRRGLLSPDTHR